MRKETDLSKVKTVAKTFLMQDIKETPMSPLVVKHPFTDSALIVAQDSEGRVTHTNLLEDEHARRDWQKQMEKQIELARSAFHIHFMIAKPYRLAFLKYARPFLSRADFSEILSDAWIRSEYPSYDPNVNQSEQLAMFRAADPAVLMDEDEYETFSSLEDSITVYRGVTSYNAENVKALSWTLNYDTAVWFAHRFGEDGTVYEAQVAKKHILALFNSKSEQEVIVDPQHLIEISEAQVMDDGLSLSR